MIVRVREAIVAPRDNPFLNQWFGIHGSHQIAMDTIEFQVQLKSKNVDLNAYERLFPQM